MVKETIIEPNRTVFRKTKKYRAALFLILGLFTVIAVGITAASAEQISLKTKMASHSESDMSRDDSDISHEKIDTGIEKAVSFLKERQLPSGGFPSYISKNPDLADGAYLPLIFDTTFVLHALNFVDSDSEVDEIKNKTAGFLLANKEDPGVWRYYGKDPNLSSDWSASLLVDPYIPPDLDDTAVAFASLREYGIPVEDSGLEYALNFRSPDGLFYTWINEEKWLNQSDPIYWYYKRNNVDPIVNANMLYALSLSGKQAPEVSDYLNGYIKNNSFAEFTVYYYDPYTQLYMFTRAYADGHVEDLEPSMPVIRDYLLNTQKPDGSWGNELNTSLAAVSLLNTGYKGKALDKAVAYILNTQGNDGGWPKIGFGTGDIYPVYVGSEEFTTAFSLEALGKYSEMHRKNKSRGEKE